MSDNPDRTAKGELWKVYFRDMSDDDIQRLLDACEQELELRSQEEIQV